jgi:phage terminase large subunit-like protein
MRFAERYLRIPEGKHVGKPIRLVEFQECFFYSIFDNPAITRRAFLIMARKNGKTALIAIILLCFLIGPEALQNSQIVSGALSRDQAALVWNLANKMLSLNPELEDVTHVIPSGKKLIGKSRNVEYKALSAEGKTNHGLSPVCGILDEMGQVRGPYDSFIEAVETSQGAWENPLLLIISTQAPTNGDWLSIQLDDAENSQDPRIVAHVYAAPEDCELDDEEAWVMANPALGLFLNKNELIDGAEKAKRLPSFSNSFQNLHLNKRIDIETPFVSRMTWESNGLKPESLVGEKVYGGLDLSAVSDLTGLVLVGEAGDVEVKAWLPKEGIVEKSRNDRVPYDVWAKEGLLTLTPGKSIQYEWVATELRRVFDAYDVVQINFDRYNMKFLRPWLEKAGFTEKDMEKFNDFGQGFVSMSPALRSLETSLLQSELKHGMNPILTMCMGNCVVEMDAAGNRKFTKKKSTGRIDLAVCLAMAEDARLAHKDKSKDGEWSLHFV